MNQISLAEYGQQIERSIESGHYDEAVAHGKHILEQYPKYLRAYWLMGKAMLEAGRHEHAADMFQRVLSADPEQMLAWVGMSEVAEQRGELEAAVWYLERAFELATDNEMVANQLRRLQGRLEGREPERLQLTQGALARLYLRGDLLSRAVTELHKLLDEHPDRLDLKVALAEALWRSGRRVEASEVCQDILEQQPYNLKANLILGEVWTNSGRKEGELYLRRAEEVDPENRKAQELFGTVSPLPPQDPQITPAEYELPLVEGGPARLIEGERLPPAEETALLEPDELMTTKIEIPLWLQEMAEEGLRMDSDQLPASERETDEEELPSSAEAASEEAEAASEEAEGGEEVVPEDLDEDDGLEWLTGSEEKEGAPGELEAAIFPDESEDEIPAWFADVGIGTAEEEALDAQEFEEGEEPERAEIPAWFADVGIEPAQEEAFDVQDFEEDEEPERAEIPDWLRDLAPAEFEPRRVPSAEELAALLDEATDLDEMAVPEEIEDVTDLPAWLAEAEIPPADDAIDWLEQLTEEEEADIRAEAEREAPLPEGLGLSELAPEEPAEQADELAQELVAEPEEEMDVDEVRAFEDAEAVPGLPAWLESEDIPSGDDALAWLEELAEEREAELRVPAEEEPEVPAEEILWRPELTYTGTDEPAGFAEAPVPTEPEAKEAEEMVSAEEPMAVLEEGPRVEESDMPRLEEELEEPVEPMEAEELEAEQAAVEEILAAEQPSVSGEEEGARVEEMELAPPEEELYEEVEAAEAEDLEAEEAAAEEILAVEEGATPADAEARVGEPEAAPLEEEDLEKPVAAPEEEAFVWAPPDEEAPEAGIGVPPVEATEGITPSEEAEREEAFGWTAFGEETEEAVSETEDIEAEEEAITSEELEPTLAEERVEEPAVGDEVPVEMIAPGPEEGVPALDEREAEDLQALAEEEAMAAEAEIHAPAPSFEEAPAEEVRQFVAKRRVHIEENPEDHEARLELGRVLWQVGQRDEAVEAYDHLIQRGELLDKIIPDLEDYEEQWGDPSIRQTLGDAYVKADRLQDALDVYRKALASL